MEHYVTLFDSYYLPQGLALRKSLEDHAGKYTLWVLCMDEKVFNVLSGLGLENLQLIKLNDVITPELARVKEDRNTAEFCWTCTPFAPKFVFDIDLSIQRVTYIDADVWLRKNPKVIFSEFEDSNKSVLITRHGYTPEYDNSTKVGIYCVQFMIFKRDECEKVRSWWEDRCIEWCFSYPEDGKLGDQKYLDDWESLFEDDVHVLERQELTLAPWNAQRFPYSDAVIYHFHGLRIMGKNKVNIGGYILPPPIIDKIYKPYLQSLKSIIGNLANAGFEPIMQLKNPGILWLIKRRLGSIYHQRWRFIPRYFMDL